MCKVFLRFIPAVAMMVGILLAGATPARANLEIQLSTDNITYMTVASVVGGATQFTGAFGGYAIVVLATASNSPGTPTFAELDGADLTIENVNAGDGHLFIKLGDTDFTSPTTPPNILMESHVGGTIPVADASNTLTFQSYVDNVTPNGQNTTVGITTGAQTPGITGGSFNDTTSTLIASLSAPYSITEFFDLHLSEGSRFNFSSSTTLTSVVPEPSSMAIAGLGALGLIGYGIRRRRGA
jgi:hypothetical protein